MSKEMSVITKASDDMFVMKVILILEQKSLFCPV